MSIFLSFIHIACSYNPKNNNKSTSKFNKILN